MTPEQQRIAIAKACGYTDVRREEWEVVDIDAREVACCEDVRGTRNGERQRVPDYCADLNAMHEAEKVLVEKGVNAWWTYVGHINRSGPTPLGTETAVHATAAQRAEAFLRTVGKWEDGK